MEFEPRTVVWITGATGRMGRAISKALDRGTYVILGTDEELDVTDSSAVMQYASVHRPQVIVNCAGMVDQQTCEENPVEAYRVNAIGARNLATAAESIGATIVQLSTDDVFSGKERGSYNEFDAVIPRENAYAKSKIAGENFVVQLNPHHVIVRSNWVYSDEPGSWFAGILESARLGKTLELPRNRFASPTSITTVASCVVALIKSGEYGLFHAADQGTVSRYDFACKLLELVGLPSDSIIPTDDPADASTLNLVNLMLTMTGVYQMPDWESDLRAYLASRNLLGSE